MLTSSTGLQIWSFCHQIWSSGDVKQICQNEKNARAARAARAHLGNGGYFVIIASSSYPLLLTENAANELVEAPLK